MPHRDVLKPRYDVVVIGGGVHGAAVALEATRRGYEVLLVEKGDFCSGASANSLKIVHGGLRYLQSADLRRSRESAAEQQALMRLAPHLVKPMPCLVGARRSLTANRAALSLGVWFYDRVICAGLGDRPRGRSLDVPEANRLAGVEAFTGCTGAVLWHDARVVDSERLVLSYLMTAEGAGAHIRNYTEAVAVDHGAALRVSLREAGAVEAHTVEADRVIDTASMVEPSPAWTRAVNLVIRHPPAGHAFGTALPGPSPDAGRLFFAVPFGERTVLGTWYFPDRSDPLRLTRSELRRCLADARQLLPGVSMAEDDVALVHLGRLPVADPADPLSLLETPVISTAGGDDRVVSVTGVKYTTARPTAAKALDRAGLRRKGNGPASFPFYGTPGDAGTLEKSVADRVEGKVDADRAPAVSRRLCRQYGAVALDIATLAAASPRGFEPVAGEDAIRAEIDYCIDIEHCRTLADFLVRRSGLGSAGKPPGESARRCAAVMAERLDWTEARTGEEIAAIDAFYDRLDP